MPQYSKSLFLEIHSFNDFSRLVNINNNFIATSCVVSQQFAINLLDFTTKSVASGSEIVVDVQNHR